jgi:hypothetical protein
VRGAASTLAGATLARAASADEAAAAVGRAVARLELERPVPRLGIAALDDAALAQSVAASLAPGRDVTAGTVEALGSGGFDAIVAIASASLPAAVVVERVRTLGDALLGVVLVSEPGQAQPAHEPAPTPADDALEALALLERAAESGPGRPAPAAATAPPPATAPPADGRARQLEAELERRLAELERREAAFRKISQVVAQRSETSGEAGPALAAANERAALAESRAAELEERVRALQARVDELEAARSERPAAGPGHTGRLPTIDRLERAVARAFDEGQPQAEEWSFYLPLLRERADAQGRLPPELDALVESVFGEALSA